MVSLLCFCAATYTLWNVDAESGPGHLASSAVVLVLNSCCQCQDGLQAWMWPLKGCSETQTPLPRFHTYTAAISPEVTQLDSTNIATITVRKWLQQPVAMTTNDKKHPVTTGELIMEAARGADSVPKLSDTTARNPSCNFGSWLLFIHQSSFKWWPRGWTCLSD